MSYRWTNDFLDHLRAQGDKLADDHLDNMLKDQEIIKIGDVFKSLNSNDDQPIETIFPALADFCRQTGALPPDVDLARIRRGEDIFIRHAFPAALVLLTKSLPEGYAAPNLALVLNISKNLVHHPYKRLLQVLQMLLNVCASRGFEPQGKAIITAQKVRLLHSGIRRIAHKYLPSYQAQYGTPVNLEDMLATLMAFSLLVIRGLRHLDCGLTPDEEEDYFYVWRIYALVMGIHPAERPYSMEFIPDNVADADAFYQAYARRHYTMPADNPDGVDLTRANIKLLHDMIPTWLRIFGFGLAPRVYMQHLIGIEACRRVGFQPLPGHAALKWLLFRLPQLWLKLSNLFINAEKRFHRNSGHHYFSMKIFQGMIDREFGGQVTFSVPVTLQDLMRMG